MTEKDLLIDLGSISHKYYEEAENDTLSVHGNHYSARKVILIAAVITLLAITITACAYAIHRIRMNLVQHNIPVETEMVIPNIDYPEETIPVNVLTDCYPQTLPDGYAILSGSPTSHTSRGIVYQKQSGNSIHFHISTMPQADAFALKPPVAETAVTLSCGKATYLRNEGAQVLLWHNEQQCYDASLFTDDMAVDLISMAESMGYGEPIPMSVWYHRGQEWDPWYPQTLPEGYACKDVSPVGNGYQNFTYENGSGGYIRYGISTVRDLMSTESNDQSYWEDVEVNGYPAKIKRNSTTQRTLFWHNEAEGFYAFLETEDETVDLVILAENVAPGPKMEVSKSYLGPDYTIELEQEPTAYIGWQSVYPQNIPDGYELEYVGDRAYGQQRIEWKNQDGEMISFTLYFRLGQHGREFEGSGEPEAVSINGRTGYKIGNSLLWVDEELGFAYELRITGNVDLVTLAQSVGSGPELPLSNNDRTNKALEQLGDYHITELPKNMIEDGLSGAPLENENDWYSYVRRWYYDRSNNDQVYFTYETYLTDCNTEQEVLKLFVPAFTEPEFGSIQGYPAIMLQEGQKAYVTWLIGDVNKGVCFQLYSEQFTVEELLVMAESVQRK